MFIHILTRTRLFIMIDEKKYGTILSLKRLKITKHQQLKKMYKIDDNNGFLGLFLMVRMIFMNAKYSVDFSLVFFCSQHDSFSIFLLGSFE